MPLEEQSRHLTAFSIPRANSNYPDRNVILLPAFLREEIVEAAHGQLLSGHMGVFETKERICQSYYWPNMDADIYKHIYKCTTCQERRFQHLERSEKLTPLPLCTEPNQRVHIDLFGPLKSNSGKKMVMCMTDAFTKYIEVTVIPNKKATTVAEAILPMDL